MKQVGGKFIPTLMILITRQFHPSVSLIVVDGEGLCFKYFFLIRSTVISTSLLFIFCMYSQQLRAIRPKFSLKDARQSIVSCQLLANSNQQCISVGESFLVHIPCTY
jgi:hypothetical protein